VNGRRETDTNTRNLRVIAGEWRIARRLGRGGTANVYLAMNIHDGRKAALKILRRELVGQKTLETRFIREAELTARVRHPNVLLIHGHGRVQDGRPYIVAELLDGETLDEQRLATREKRLPWRDVVNVGLCLLDALAAAHKAGVVHRDVKPTNVFVTKDGEVKLLDFGIAGLGEDKSVLTSENTRTALGIGTPLFMAPEQLTGDDAIDGRADLFGTAATIFHAMSGRVPFGTSSFSVGALIAAYSGGPADLRELVPDVPRQVARVVTRALAMRPRERFGSADDMRAALAGALELSNEPPAPATKPQVWLDQTAPLPTVRKMQVAAALSNNRPASYVDRSPAGGTPDMAMRPPGSAIPSTPPGSPRAMPSAPSHTPTSAVSRGSTPPGPVPSPRAMPSVPPPSVAPRPGSMHGGSEDLSVAARPRSTRPHPGPPPEAFAMRTAERARAPFVLATIVAVVLVVAAVALRRFLLPH
jgi:serine/threonine-protein kinase